LLITGATGSAGSNIVELAAAQRRIVRAMVRDAAAADPLHALGAEVVQGDVTDPSSLRRAMHDVTQVVHAAGALSGPYRTLTDEDMWAVNYHGAVNVLEAAKAEGVERVVMIDSNSIFDWSYTQTETAPVVAISDVDSHYVQAKRAAFYAGMHRACRGEDIVFVTPGAIYGPGPFIDRALDATTFTRLLVRGLTGELSSFPSFPMAWTYVRDLAEICIRSLDRGRPGRRYLAMGAEADVSSVAAFCNEAAALAGVRHRVQDVDPRSAEGRQVGTFAQFAERIYASPLVDCAATTKSLDYPPTPRADALRVTLDWLQQNGKLAP
jgi:dihydroflavonol-4-reductase